MFSKNFNCFLIFGFLFAAVLHSTSYSFAQESFAQEKSSQSSSNYPATGNVQKGTWNDGQAALWDLNIIDHFHYFGPKERAKGYKPEQPIKFSHVTHVQKNKIECQFCHWSAAKSPYAAIPEVETCVGCHRVMAFPGSEPIATGVVGKDDAAKSEIKKIHEYFLNNKQIPWVKVHVTPDYVKFNHKRHIKAGMSCHECHGQVPEMDVVERVSSMKMGWCVSCHRAQGTSIDCYTCHR
jgi:Cytochrome c7 and related cytochrome c